MSTGQGKRDFLIPFSGKSFFRRKKKSPNHSDSNWFNRCSERINAAIGYLCQSIRRLTSLKNLSLSFKYFITDAEIPELCRALKTLSSLQTISLNFERYFLLN